MHAEGLRVRGERSLEISLRGEDQPLAATCARLAPGAVDPAHTLLEIRKQPARLVELAQLDECLDRIRELAVDARLAPSQRVQASRQRPQDAVGGSRVADRELE